MAESLVGGLGREIGGGCRGGDLGGAGVARREMKFKVVVSGVVGGLCGEIWGGCWGGEFRGGGVSGWGPRFEEAECLA